jgi:hypothetical protein
MTSPFAEFAAVICFGPKARARLQSGICPDCGCFDAASTLTSDLSRREFKITGLCQACQDSVFGSDG